MNKPNQKGFAFVIIPIAAVTIILLLGAVLYFQTQQTSAPNPIPSAPSTSDSEADISSELKTFKSSDVMNFEIDIPKNYNVEEKFGAVAITTPHGEIRISQNGTNLDDLNEHILLLQELNKVKFEKETDLVINNLASQKGKLNGKPTYFIYADYAVYLISTKEEVLFEDLDQIAKSFRYTPN